MTIRGITVGVDGSLISVRALDRAADAAALRATALEIVYAVPDLDEAGPVLASAASRVRARHPGLPIATVPVEGHAATVLAACGRDAALTVVGCRGFGGITGAVLGSVSRRLASLVSGPVLVVRGDCPPHPYGEVLLVLDRESGTDAAAYAFDEAELRGARLRTLRFSAGAAQILLEATRTADVVVTARRQGAGAHGRHLGSATRTLLHRSHCPVLIIPPACDSSVRDRTVPRTTWTRSTRPNKPWK